MKLNERTKYLFNYALSTLYLRLYGVGSNERGMNERMFNDILNQTKGRPIYDFKLRFPTLIYPLMKIT